MKTITAQVNYIMTLAGELDNMGMSQEADAIVAMSRAGVERYAQIVSGGGGVQEYFNRLVQLAVSKGVEYAAARMNENRIVVLNDGTPVMKFADPPGFRDKVINKAKEMGAKSNPNAVKNMKSTRRFDPRKAGEAQQKYEGWSQGKPSPAGQGLGNMKPAQATPAQPKSAPATPKYFNPSTQKKSAPQAPYRLPTS